MPSLRKFSRPVSGVLIFFGLLAFASAQDTRQIPMADPVYAFLERAKVNAWISYLPEVRPYYQKQAAAWLKEIRAASEAGTIKLQDAEKAYLEEEIKVLEGGREHLGKTPDDTVDFTFDIGGEFNDVTPLNRPADSFPYLGLVLAMDIDVADIFYLAAKLECTAELSVWNEDPFALFDEPFENDQNIGIFDLDTGDVSSDTRQYHSAGQHQLAIAYNDWIQTGLDLGPVQLSFSREALDWGPGISSRLLLSSTAKPYESLWMNIPIDRIGNFSWMMGFLQDIRPIWSTTDPGDKFVNVHRLELQPLPWFTFAIHESVVYAPEFNGAYLLPLGLIISDQVRTGAHGKKSIGVDFMFSWPGVRAYLSSFLDDWNMLNPLSLTAFRDTYGLLLGVETQDLFTPGLSLDFEAGYASKWLYTSGASPDGKSYTNFGSNLGSEMQPNSLLLTLKSEYAITPVLKPGITLQWYFHGDGSVYTTYDPAAEAALYGVSNANEIIYSFLDMNSPNGVPISSTFNARFYLDWFVPRLGLKVHGGYTLQIYANKDNQAGKDGVDHILDLSVNIFGY